MTDCAHIARKGACYITQQGLQNLAHYGYSGVDNSFFGNLVLKHLWNWSVEQVPMWFAPNLLTLLGLICNVTGYALMASYTPTLQEAAPRWVFFVVALLIFIYQTLDNIDGKQARRTKSSSPLGELFDHGCDAMSVAMFALITAATVRLGGPLTFWGALLAFGPFYLAHWEEYHVGMLVMGAFNGPTEAQLIVMALLVATGIGGPDMWVARVVGDLRVHHIAFMFTAATSLITVAQNVIKVTRLPNRATPLTECFTQLIPLLLFTLTSLVWLVVAQPYLLETHPHPAVMTLGVVFAYLVTRLIIHRVCKEPIVKWHKIQIVLAVAAFMGVVGAISGRQAMVGALGPLGDPVVQMWILLGVASSIWAFFAVSVIHQLTSHLGIRVFTIRPPSDTPSAAPTPEHQERRMGEGEAEGQDLPGETTGLLATSTD